MLGSSGEAPLIQSASGAGTWRQSGVVTEASAGQRHVTGEAAGKPDVPGLGAEFQPGAALGPVDPEQPEQRQKAGAGRDPRHRRVGAHQPDMDRRRFHQQDHADSHEEGGALVLGRGKPGHE
ncbi:MAG: hypothetical protein ABI836_10165 [Gemmatimonadota bacterium]